MKKFAFALALILWCSFTTPTTSRAVVPVQRPDWNLVLKTGGAPFEKKFEVTLNHTGALNVTVHDPTTVPPNKVSKFSFNLSTDDAQQVYEQALKAFREFQFPRETEIRPDGTNLTLQLRAHQRTLTMEIFHLGVLQDELPEVARLLVLLNKHMPKDQEIY